MCVIRKKNEQENVDKPRRPLRVSFWDATSLLNSLINVQPEERMSCLYPVPREETGNEVDDTFRLD